MATATAKVGVSIPRTVARSKTSPNPNLSRNPSKSGNPSKENESRKPKWGVETMEKALKEVQEGTLTVRRAALQYGVPKSTLHDRVSGKVLPGAKPGAPRYLDEEEEEELVKFLIGAASIGYPKTVREVRAIVGGIMAKKMGVESVEVSQGWWEKFRHRHPEPKTLPRARVLTHEDNVRALKEKAEKKKEELEKERCRQEKKGKKEAKIAESEHLREEREKRKLEEQQRKKDATVDAAGSSKCTEGTCSHQKAMNWVMCAECELWFHCMCVGVLSKMSQPGKLCVPLPQVFSHLECSFPVHQY